MNKIRTTVDLETRLSEDLSWRKKEISSIKTSIMSAKQIPNKALIRAGVPLLYAHWEGFIKKASEAYLEFVVNQRLSYKELKTCFIVFGLKNQLNDIAESKQHAENIKIIEFLLNELNKKAKLSYRDVINTESNLKSKVFENIAVSLGLDTAPYTTKFNFIDVELLKRRNSIAHGEYLELDMKDYMDLSDNVVTLLNMYKNDILNAVVGKTYLEHRP
ncbi:MAG: MAE_28990/MAE_18760 family HEPN-like nuclease [Chloroflexota bacterium]